LPSSRPLRNLEQRRQHGRESSIPQPVPIAIHQPPGLVVLGLALADVVRALDGPQAPVGIVARHPGLDAVEVAKVAVAHAVVGPALEPDPELGDEQRGRVGLALGEQEAVKEPVLGLHEVAAAERVRERHGEAVGVHLPDVLPGPGREVEVRRADEGQVRGGRGAADDDEEVRVGGVHLYGALAHVVVPVRVPVEVLQEELAYFVAQRHGHDARLGLGPGGDGREAF
jgi:hypothetical protein